ncbi:MAG: NTP transferase domain-containing protein [Proteobacteria bacterium]|nr:NTP transferase domain-containing protein [Pseudomonadota bacterium]
MKKIDAACLILAGGQGKRLTPDKPLLEINGKSIIERTASVVVPLFEEVLIVTNTPEKYETLSLPFVADERRGCGPLMGIYSGLQKTKREVAFVCAADMPFLNKEIILSEFLELGTFDIVVPCPGERPEFLHAFYHKRCLTAMRENLEANLLKIEMLVQRCKTLYLDREWFTQNGLAHQIDIAFMNINTQQDYQRCLAQGEEGRGHERIGSFQLRREAQHGLDALKTIAPNVLQEVRQTLIEQETAYQHKSAEEVFSSLWSHGSRVGRIAHHIAKAEGLEIEPALLAGLLHDLGKFANGSYHENDIPEEENAVRLADKILSGTIYEKWIPIINEAILSTYLEGEATNDIGRVLYDADRLDKLGNMGVAQFFAKNALRRQFLDDDLMIRTSIELTYAHHAPDTLKTATGRSIARVRSIRTRRFYTELVEEWAMLGLGAFNILEEDIAGIVCILVVPCVCSCGGRLKLESDIRDSVKCRSVLVKYICVECGIESEFSFCLPNVKGLPQKR